MLKYVDVYGVISDPRVSSHTVCHLRRQYVDTGISPDRTSARQ
jgi:hypothetical protein